MRDFRSLLQCGSVVNPYRRSNWTRAKSARWQPTRALFSSTGERCETCTCPCPAQPATQHSGRHHHHRAAVCHLPDLQLSARRAGQGRLAGDPALCGDLSPELAGHPDAIGPGYRADPGGALRGGPGHLAGDWPPGLRPLRGRPGAAAVCRQDLYVGAPVDGQHDGEKGVQPARGAGGLSHSGSEVHWISDAHA